MSSLRVQKLLNHISPMSEDEILYFGYGSNLSLSSFKQFKNVDVLSYCCGIIYDWKLSFSLCYPTKAFGNIHCSKGDAVHGIIMRLKQSDFTLLKALEISYRAVKLKAYSYQNRTTKPLDVYTFVFDKQCEDRIKHELATDSTIKQVPRFFDIHGGGRKPDKNYVDTIIRGAKELKLDSDYIKTLETVECVPIVQYKRTVRQLQQINNKIWTLPELTQYMAQDSARCVSILKGIVFDMAQFPPSWKPMVRGKDMTMFYAKRWAYAKSDNCESLDALETQQKVYVNGEVQKFLNGLYGVKILGKMDKNTYKFAHDNYKW
eukprot:14509_1